MKTKTLQKTEPKRPPGRPAKNENHDGGVERMILERKIRAEIEAGPERSIERSERYKRMLKAGTTGTVYVINAAQRDELADEAVRQHIADLIDQGRESELTMQLRAYAVKNLIYPMGIMQRRD